MDDALEFLKRELNNENPIVRVNAAYRLPIVVYSYKNPQQKKKEIINFIDSYIKKCESDEVLFGLAQILGDLASYFQQDMLKVLLRLLVNEETVIRDAAIQAFVKMLDYISKEDLSKTIVPEILNLKSQKKFPPKISALNLMSAIFPRCNSKDQQLLLNKIVGMISEDSLILRRSLAKHMGTLCKYVKKDILLHGYIKQFKILAIDDSDSVRIICMESIIDIAKCLNSEENKSHLIPIIIQLTGDKSWKVKLHLAKNFAKLAEALGPDICENPLFSIFSTLLRDLENEVRIEAVKSLRQYVKLFSNEKIIGIFAYLQTLSIDTVALVRTHVCEVIQEIFKIHQKFSPEIVKNRIQPIILELVQDKDIEVRLEALKLLEPWAKISEKSVIDIIQSNKLKFDLNDVNWRVRLEELKALMNISHIVAKKNAFKSLFKEPFLKGLQDKASEVRKYASGQVQQISTYLSPEDLGELLNEVKKIIENNQIFYSYRIDSIETLNEFYNVIESQQMKSAIVSYLEQLSQQDQRNIRNVVLRIMKQIHKRTREKDQQNQIEQRIKAMVNDKDKEVSMQANWFLQGIAQVIVY